MTTQKELHESGGTKLVKSDLDLPIDRLSIRMTVANASEAGYPLQVLVPSATDPVGFPLLSLTLKHLAIW